MRLEKAYQTYFLFQRKVNFHSKDGIHPYTVQFFAQQIWQNLNQ